MEVDYLTDDNNEKRICELYWQLDEGGLFDMSIKDISVKSGYTAYQINNIAKSNSIAYSDSTFCENCGGAYIYDNRTDYLKHDEGHTWTCQNCIDEALNDEDRIKREILTNSLNTKSKEPISVETLSVTQACYLTALLRHSGAEDMSCINELTANDNDKLTPHPRFDLKILESLFRDYVIAIDPGSDTARMELAEGNSVNFYLNAVRWLVVFGGNYGSLGQFYEELEELLPIIAEDKADEFNELIKAVSLQESLDYLETTLERHGFNFNPGEKTHQVLNLCLQDYSVAQVYNFIWRAGRDAAAYYMRENIPKKQAANSVVTRIDKSRERAQANDWDVTAYRRDYNVHQSALSRVIFNTILNTDDGGFHLPLRELMLS